MKRQKQVRFGLEEENKKIRVKEPSSSKLQEQDDSGFDDEVSAGLEKRKERGVKIGLT